MTLTEIRLRLNELGIHPSRRLGQNFLHDQNVAQRIVELGEIHKGQAVIEIGPGLGALTEWITKCQPEQLTLMEKDRRLAEYLRTHFSQANVIEGDALDKISDFGFRISDFLVLGNLPYSVASPLIVSLCEEDLRPARMVFTIQLEVATRLIAKSSTKDFGLLTLFTQAFYEVEMVRKLSPTVFWPQPEVESAVVVMKRRPVMPFSNSQQETCFRGIVKEAFQKRRKSLGAILGKRLPAQMDRNRRPEELSIAEWVQLASHSISSPPAKEGVGEVFSRENPKPPPLTLPKPTAKRGWHEERGKDVGSEEIFDVVDKHDAVISQERRSEVHRKNLLHRAIHIFIWNQEGKLLLQKRSALKDVAPNTWDSSAAGHLGTDEDYDPAAEREIVEELGIKTPLRRIKKFEACQELGWEFVWLYEGASEGPFKFPEIEISELQWWTAKEIDEGIRQRPKDFAPSFCYIWKHRRVLKTLSCDLKRYD
jgi:16S rRNA (adenine1518-N6/adenine1519-N6)-dimethyltransferase